MTSVSELPVILSIPHCGTEIPSDIRAKMDPGIADTVPDTDFLLQDLYSFAPSLGIQVIHAQMSRYVVDLNRDPEGQGLYHDGRIETGLVPIKTFDQRHIYLQKSFEPTAAEVQQRFEQYGKPYHDKIVSSIAELRKEFKNILLFDAHSIVREPKFLKLNMKENFKPLPDFMLGTNSGKSCAEQIRAAAQNYFLKVCQKSQMTFSTDNQFKGGYITRHYGDPVNGVHAFQLEMSQDIYLDGNIKLHPTKSASLALILKQLLLDLSQTVAELT